MSWETMKGKEYTDTLHGITGIVTKRTEFLAGEPIICLETVDGLNIVTNWFDESLIKPATKKESTGFKTNE